MSSTTRSLLARTMVIAAVAVFAIVAGIPAMLGGLRSPGVVAAASGDPTHGITVQGTAIISLKPDMASLYLGVDAQASTATQAQSNASKAMAAVIAAVRKEGVADTDLATQGINLNPTYEPMVSGTPHVNGYQASQSLSIKVRDLDKVGPVIDAGVAAGATSVGGISFSLADPTAATDQARQMAVADAHKRAQTLATAAGVTLGAPISVTEESATQPPVYYAASGATVDKAAIAPTPVQVGTTDVTVTVDVVYSIS